MKNLLILFVFTFMSFLLTDCTCNCSKQYTKKMDPKLIESIEDAKNGGVNPFFVVEIKLNTNYNDDIKKQLTDIDVSIESNTEKSVIAKAQTKAIKKTAELGFVEYITLLTANYYPNK